MDSKAPSKNPSLVFEDVGSAGGRAEFRTSGTSPYALSLVCIDSANKSTFHTLITNGGSRNWVIPSELAEIKNSFQAGVDTLYNKCKNRGATPSSKTPTAISAAIDTIYTNRYNAGFSAGEAAASYSVEDISSKLSAYASQNHGFRSSVSLSGYKYVIVCVTYQSGKTANFSSFSGCKCLAQTSWTAYGASTSIAVSEHLVILSDITGAVNVSASSTGTGNVSVRAFGFK